MRKILSLIAIALTSVMVAAPASASLIGTTVKGSLQFGTNLTNYFDPANGGVPASGYTNSSSNSNSATVVIAGGSQIEFGYADAANTDSADFNGGSLKIVDVSTSGGSTAKYIFTDAAFAGLTLVETSDTFLNGGATATLVGTTLTVITPDFTRAGTYTASYSLTAAAAVPEPSSIAILGLGLLGFAASRRKSVKNKNA